MQNAITNTNGLAGQADDYLTKLQVAGLFQVTPRCIDQWMGAGILPYFKLGKSVRFSRSAISSHLNEKFKRN
jgi:hypothetical protein